MIPWFVLDKLHTPHCEVTKELMVDVPLELASLATRCHTRDSLIRYCALYNT